MKSLSDLLTPVTDPTERLRLEAFGQMYSTPEHLWLARCAAFPVALTTDLLYKIWLNFRQTDTGETLDIPINVVGDILLSPLCREIGYDLYEMYPETRALLWQSLPPAVVASLAEFTLRYLDFCRDKSPSDAFTEAQRIWAESFQHPQKVLQLLRQLLSERKTNLGSKIMADYVLSWVKNRNQWANQTLSETTTQRDSLSNLAQIAEGIQQYEKGQISEANATFSSLSHLLNAPRESGFNVPIPKKIWEDLPLNSQITQPKGGKIYAVLVGIDAYGEGMQVIKFTGCINDVHTWQTLLKEHYTTIEIVSLLDAQATKEAILQALRNAISILSPDDTLFFTFSGHAHNKDLPHALAAYDTVAVQRETYLSETEFKSIISSPNTSNPFVVVVLDTHGGSAGWIDTNNEKQVLLAATANGEMSIETDKKGLFTATLHATLEQHKYLISYKKLIKETFKKIKEGRKKQNPQIFGRPESITNSFLEGNLQKQIYLDELLQISGYTNPQEVLADFPVESQNKEIVITSILERYSLIHGSKELKIMLNFIGVNKTSIPIFASDYIHKLPFKVSIKMGLPKTLEFYSEADEELHYLLFNQNHIIVFFLNDEIIRFINESSRLGSILGYLHNVHNKVICSVFWENCDWQTTVLKDYPVFSLRQPLSRAAFQKYNFAPEVEREIEQYYQDWQPVINKWVTDLAEIGFEKELKERIEKAKQTQELDLSGMGFEKLPEAVWELKDLKIIDLYNNKLTELPGNLTQFQSLEKLLASKNPITTLPLFLSDLPKLRVLKIDDAQITELPNWLCKHPALEDISLENNQIEIIPSTLKDLPKLRLIDFRGNPVINLSDTILKSTKGQLKNHVENVRKNIPQFIDEEYETTLLFLDSETEDELNLIKRLFTIEKIVNDKEDLYSLNIYSILVEHFETIFYFLSPKDKTSIVHLSQNNLSNEEIKKLSKLFPEYPTGTIFFLNFSNSKHLAELLYQQKHAPIIAFEGELDSQEATEAVRLFYSHYQESKNAVAAFDNMVLQLATISTSSKGLYILYRY